MRTRSARISILLAVVLVVLGLAGPIAAEPQVCAGTETVEAFDDPGVVGGAEGVAVAKNGDVFFGATWEGVVFKASKGDFGATFAFADLAPAEIVVPETRYCVGQRGRHEGLGRWTSK